MKIKGRKYWICDKCGQEIEKTEMTILKLPIGIKIRGKETTGLIKDVDMKKTSHFCNIKCIVAYFEKIPKDAFKKE